MGGGRKKSGQQHQAAASGAHLQRMQFRQVLECRPSHKLDWVVVKMSGKKETKALVQMLAFFSGPCASWWRLQQFSHSPAILALSRAIPLSAPTTSILQKHILQKHQKQEPYSHCLQERVAHEGLLWDSLDVVVVETPGRQHPGAVRS